MSAKTIARFESLDAMTAGAQRLLRCHRHQFSVIPDPNNPMLRVDELGLKCLIMARDRKVKRRHVLARQYRVQAEEARAAGLDEQADRFDQRAKNLESR